MTAAKIVMPAQSPPSRAWRGIQGAANYWIPAFAGMTLQVFMSGHDFVNAQ